MSSALAALSALGILAWRSPPFTPASSPPAPAAAPAPVAVTAPAAEVASNAPPPSSAAASASAPVFGQPWTVPGLGLELMPIPAGSFSMGDANGELNERPPTRVRITLPYWLGKYEVTQAEWHAVTGENPSKFIGERLPVERVSWDEANSFCRKLTERESQAGRLPEAYVYSLPTEAEWEHACRAGTTGDYGGTGRAKDMGWFDGNPGNRTHVGGQKRANAWGLNDMHGNVAEWCLDWYWTYPGGELTDPAGPATGTLRVRRGGSWRYKVAQCRSATRMGNDPTISGDGQGLRVALRPAVYAR